MGGQAAVTLQNRVLSFEVLTRAFVTIRTASTGEKGKKKGKKKKKKEKRKGGSKDTTRRDTNHILYWTEFGATATGDRRKKKEKEEDRRES